MNPLSIHIANISEGYQLKLGPLLEKQAINIFGGTTGPAARPRSRVVNWLSVELIVLALTLAGITGMLLGMVLRNAFGGTP